MENKIQELTDKIYREGVEKGNEEAQRLVSEAQVQAEKLIEDAKKQAESILAEAKKTADELNENTKSELKLFAGQAVNALKTEVANLLTNQTVEETVKGFTADKEFLYKLLNSSYKCNGIHINNLFKFFVWCEVSKSFTRSII